MTILVGANYAHTTRELLDKQERLLCAASAPNANLAPLEDRCCEAAYQFASHFHKQTSILPTKHPNQLAK